MDLLDRALSSCNRKNLRLSIGSLELGVDVKSRQKAGPQFKPVVGFILRLAIPKKTPLSTQRELWIKGWQLLWLLRSRFTTWGSAMFDGAQ